MFRASLSPSSGGRTALQWNAVRPPDDGCKDTRNMLRNNWLPINHYSLHLVGSLTLIYLPMMHGHSSIKFVCWRSPILRFLQHITYKNVVKKGNDMSNTLWHSAANMNFKIAISHWQAFTSDTGAPRQSCSMSDRHCFAMLCSKDCSLVTQTFQDNPLVWSSGVKQSPCTAGTL